MAANNLFAGVAGWLLGEAVGYDLAAPLPSAPPLLRHGTHGGCDWFTGICSVPARETWRNRNRSYCELPSRPAPAPPEKRGAPWEAMSPPGGPAHRGGSGVAGPWADA